MTAAAAKMGASNKSLPRAANAGSMASKDGESLTQSQDIPIGFCQCGCGLAVGRWSASNATKGIVKGEFKRFLPYHHLVKPSDRYSVEDRGYKTACWIWPTIRFDGYARGCRGGKMVFFYRWYYEQKYGPVPEGLVMDHLCRVRACVNPDHMEAVTPAENCRRGAKAKLTVEKVAQIKARGNESLVSLAAEFGVSSSAIWSIRNGTRWADVEPATLIVIAGERDG